MDRQTTIAWIEELARDTSRLAGPAEGPALAVRAMTNPTCGDEVRLELRLGPDGRPNVRGSARGCSLSTAATVVAVDAVATSDLAHARTMIESAIDRRLTGSGSTPDGDIGALAVLDLVPLRGRCVAFPWQVIKELLTEAEVDGD